MAAAPGMGLPLLGPARRAEADDLVRAVAERPHARLAAAAQRDGAPPDLDLVAVLVGEPERAAYEQRAVAVRRDRRRLIHLADRTRARRSDTRPGSMRPHAARGTQAAGHRSADRELDRLLHRPPRAGGGGRARADGLRPRAAHHAARG